MKMILKNNETGNFIEFKLRDNEFEVITEEDQAKMIGDFSNLSFKSLKKLCNSITFDYDNGGTSEIENFEKTVNFIAKNFKIEQLFVNCLSYDESSADWNGYAAELLKLADKVEINFTENEFVTKNNNEIFVSCFSDFNYFYFFIPKNRVTEFSIEKNNCFFNSNQFGESLNQIENYRKIWGIK